MNPTDLCKEPTKNWVQTNLDFLNAMKLWLMWNSTTNLYSKLVILSYDKAILS